ncbi:putative RecA/RadA family phage recombinase [Peteryoungia aggregata LMG 23059]|uniref:RecA/RadA family phage recombinase n=1 Tax=Peteryoungia aggregata LMG 23059 TaxID=1368425 RepID=A0ABU0GAB1_9HYPH|nr:DUF2190 family protein [Peteryoungia aggregata]MDQ0422296.1 putative RecA/RadA family phage recombinase [Peteryoungia aggregata LMG 23059]
MKTFVQPGKTLTLTAPAGGVVSGKFYKIGAFFGVAHQSAVAGAKFDLECGGVYGLEKVAGNTFAEGADVYATPAGLMTSVASGNTKVGATTAVAAAGDVNAQVRLNDNF